MEDRLRMKMRAYKANPCEETAVAWAQYAVLLDDQNPSTLKIEDIRDDMGSCWGRLLRIIKNKNLTKDSSLEELAMVDGSFFVLGYNFGYTSTYRMVDALENSGIKVDPSWKIFKKYYHGIPINDSMLRDN